MVFRPNIPQEDDTLDTSQLDLLNNNTQLDTSFAIDHYAFSDLTANNGKHNQVTTPLIVGGTHPVTAAAEPKFYAMQDSANIGVIQYSRGPSSAVPSPVTYLQSPAAAINLVFGVPQNILDFTGITRAMCTLYVSNFEVLAGNYLYAVDIMWIGAPSNQFYFTAQPTTGATARYVIAQNTGNILQIANANVLIPTPQVFWALKFHRIQ